MYNDASYIAKPRNNTARSVLIGLACSAVIFVIAANITPKYSGIIWFVAFAFIVASLYVYNKYVGAVYLYEVAVYGVPTLVISLTVGKTVKTMARIDIDSITEIKHLSDAELRAYKPQKGTVKYTYYPTMLPSDVYLIAMRSQYENADIIIEADEQFISVIRRMLDNNQQSFGEEI